MAIFSSGGSKEKVIGVITKRDNIIVLIFIKFEGFDDVKNFHLK